MNFSQRKKNELRPQKSRGLSTFLIALLTASAFFVPYIITGEGYFIFYGDFNVQQIPFYQTCHAAIKSGDINWSWLTDLGANFVGSYSFYLLGSPFFWITLLFQNSFVPYLMGPLLILKFACAAFTAYLYIRRFTKNPETARLGGLLYAFSGFSVYNIFFNHFHEAIIFFPLLLLATELLITENRRGIFAITVCLCAVSNYFFFFGMAVFTAIYFFVRLFSSAIKVKISRFFVLLFEAVLGLGIAMFLLLPSILAIIGNGRVSDVLLGWNGIMYGKEQIYLNIIQCFFFPPDLPARPVFFPGAQVKWSSLGGWLPLFSMTGVFVWFINKKGTWLKRLLGISVFMALVPILNSAFYAFNSSYYARWFYMPILMMCLATSMLTEDSSVDWKSGYKWCLGITLAFALVIGLFPQEDSKGNLIFGLYTQSDDGTYIMRFWLSVAIALISLAILGLVLKLIKEYRRTFIKVATVCVCVVAVIYANVFVAMGRAHSYDIKEVVIDKMIEGNVEIEDDSEYRIDVYDGVDNTGMYLGLPSINAFHSIVPASVTEFYEFIDVSRTVASRPDTDVYAIRPLLSVKYLLNRTDGESFESEDGETQMPGFEYVKTSGGYYVYENKNYIPYGFSYDYYMTEDVCEHYSEYKTQLMLKAMLLTKEQAEKYSDYMEDIKTLYNAEESEGVTLEFSDEEMAKDCDLLAQTSAKSFEIDNKGFTAKVDREKKSLVFFSVPYDEGWSATVNGEKAQIERVNVGFMAVAVPAGTSTIRFEYNTPGMALGIKISIISVIVFAVYFVIALIFKKSHPDDTEYPEGEELLIVWHKDDIADIILQEEEPYERNSILDDLPDIEIPKINNGFSGGFKINSDIFDEKDN